MSLVKVDVEGPGQDEVAVDALPLNHLLDGIDVRGLEPSKSRGVFRTILLGVFQDVVIDIGLYVTT